MASIESINISAAKGGRKTPAGSAVLREGHGIVGDGHAGDWHRQVSLLASESIEAMRAQGLEVGPGDFAENITTRGIDLPSIPVGARLRLGTALVEVTQIGKECHTPCEIFHQAGDCVMPREGIFAKVLMGGTVSEGDAIGRDPAAEAVAEKRAEKVAKEPAEEPTGEPTEKPAGEVAEQPAENHQSHAGLIANPAFIAAVLTVSDKCHRGEREDASGDILERLLLETGAGEVSRALVPDERREIAEALMKLCRVEAPALLITTGGTGLQKRDVTPEATRDVIEREVPGIPEAIRAGALEITPRAMLSRGISGIRGSTLIINFPGSPRACEESFTVIRPVLDHILDLLSEKSCDCSR